MPIPWALISAGASLAGSLFSKNKAVSDVAGKVGQIADIGDKVTGIPTPSDPLSASQQGIDLRSFMDQAYPGTTPWERLGGNTGNFGSVTGADIQAKMHERLQSRELRNAREIAEGNNVASILAAASPQGAMAAQALVDKYHGVREGPEYATHVGLEAERQPAAKKKLAGEAERADVFGQAARGAKDLIGKAGSAAGTFVGKHIDPAIARARKGYAFLHNMNRRPSRFGEK